MHSEAILFNFRRVDYRLYEYFMYTYVQTSKFKINNITVTKPSLLIEGANHEAMSDAKCYLIIYLDPQNNSSIQKENIINNVDAFAQSALLGSFNDFFVLTLV